MLSPIRHMTSKQRRINVDATSPGRWYDVVLWLFACWAGALWVYVYAFVFQNINNCFAEVEDNKI